MSDRNNRNDIDLFRGNIPKNDQDNIKYSNLEESDTFSHFNFKKQDTEADRLRREQAEIDRLKRLEDQFKREQLEDARMKREQLEQKQREAYEKNLSNDPKIRSGERKPLKPEKYQADEYYNDGGQNNGKKPKRKKRGKKRNKLRIILLILLLLLLTFIGTLFVIKFTAKPLNFTVIGVDQRAGQSDKEIRADAIMSVSASSKDNKIIMASVPRDTFTYIPCEETEDKITHAFIYGAQNWENKGGGVACTVKSVAGLLNINTEKHVKLNFDNMVGIINAIDGVDIKSTGTFCEQNSKGKKDSFCFEKGKTYHMDGEMALAYSRHRKSDDDIQRGLRQQEVFKSMFVKVKEAKFWQWPGIYTKVTSMIDTDLSQFEMLQIALIYGTKGNMSNHKFKWEGMYYNGVSYVKLDENSIKQYTNKINALR